MTNIIYRWSSEEYTALSPSKLLCGSCLIESWQRPSYCTRIDIKTPCNLTPTNACLWHNKCLIEHFNAYAWDNLCFIFFSASGVYAFTKKIVCLPKKNKNLFYLSTCLKYKTMKNSRRCYSQSANNEHR